jgi:hypothetical protein
VRPASRSLKRREAPATWGTGALCLHRGHVAISQVSRSFCYVAPGADLLRDVIAISEASRSFHHCPALFRRASIPPGRDLSSVAKLLPRVPCKGPMITALVSRSFKRREVPRGGESARCSLLRVAKLLPPISHEKSPRADAPVTIFQASRSFLPSATRAPQEVPRGRRDLSSVAKLLPHDDGGAGVAISEASRSFCHVEVDVLSEHRARRRALGRDLSSGAVYASRSLERREAFATNFV